MKSNCLTLNNLVFSGLASVLFAVPAYCLPSAADISYQVSTAGVFSATVELDEAPSQGCVVSLESRVAVNADAVGKVRLVALKTITGTSVEFRARRMPRTKRRAGSPPELNLRATVSCPGQDEIVSNVAARYLDCGYKKKSKALGAIAWVSLLKSKIK